MAGSPPVDAVVFDLGGVLVDWNPRHLYRKLFPGREQDMERFLSEVATMAFNHRLDQGVPFSEAVADLQREHPDHAGLIAAYDSRWEEMFAGEVPGTADLLRRVKRGGQRVFVLTNSPGEKFDRVTRRFTVLTEVDGLLVSGRERLAKPDPAIFRLLCERHSLAPERSVFLDDVPANVEAARTAGLRGILFRSADQAEEELRALGVAVD